MAAEPRPSATTQPLPAFSAVLAPLEKWLSLPRVAAVLALAVAFIAWNRGIALMYAVFAVLIGMLLASVIGPRVLLRPAVVRLALPARAAVGDWVTAQLAVTPATWPRRRFLLQFPAPFPFAPGRDLFVPASGATTLRVRCTRRGVFTLDNLAVACGYPLGLLTLRRRWPLEAGAAITVFPRIHPLAAPPRFAGGRGAETEAPSTAPTRAAQLFREVREYQRGDDMRHIHWRSTARRGGLIVKTFEATAVGETWLVLDLDPAAHAGAGVNHSFERALEIAASVATALTRCGQSCGVIGGARADGGWALRVPPGAGAGHLDAILHALAGAQADVPTDYGEVLERVATEPLRARQHWMLFQHAAMPARVPAALRSATPFWFRFDTASFEAADGGVADTGTDQDPPPGNAPRRQADGVAIARDTDLRWLFTR